MTDAALGKLVDAVDALVTGAGGVRARLFEAATCLVGIRPADIPDGEARRAFVAVWNSLTSEGTLVATLQTKSEDEAAVIARRILELYLRLEH
jgi:hypothetical protein